MGNRFWFELARGSSYRGFELSGAPCFGGGLSGICLLIIPVIF